MPDQPPPIPDLPRGTSSGTQRADPSTERQATQVRCQGCGALMSWDPAKDALACEYCGSVMQVPRGSGTILERPLAEAGQAARGLGLQTRSARCGNCGATVAFGERGTSTTCVFCGSASVLEQEGNRNALRPESLIPLDVSRAAVEHSFRTWAGGLWFRPAALRNARIDQAVGVYVPYWTFDCRVASDWSADAGHYYYVTVPRMTMVRGRMQVTMVQERRVRWEPAWGRRADRYDDLLVHASRGVSAALATKLGAWDLSKLVPYRPEYLAGWSAEEYALDLAQAWDKAQAHVVATQESRCAGDVPGDTHRDLRVKNTISDARWKHVLLPLWSLSYAHGGKTYPVLIHGQSGKVSGEAPYSWVKITVLVLAALLAALFVLALAAGAAAFA